MSRKFNTKKFLKDVLNDRYALVIGNEIILDSDIEPSHDVHSFFLRKVNETYFKAVLGMRSALKVTLMHQTDGVLFDSNVGIYGQQAIPTVISMLFFWPVLIITQIWGLVR